MDEFASSHTDRPGGHIDRRRLLQLAAGSALGIGTVGIPLGTEPVAFASGPAKPVSMAMHIHGSFSEGGGSMAAHLHQATKHDIDVIWWTDHDFRATASGFRTNVAMTSPHEPAERRQSWTWEPKTEGSIRGQGHRFDSSGMTVYAGGGSGRYLIYGNAFDWTYSTSYYDTKLVLEVTTLDVDAQNQAVVHIVSSYHPATAGRPAGFYRIDYRFGGPARPPFHEDHGCTGVITIAAGNGASGTYTLDLAADHRRLWPDMVQGDASLWKLSVGVRTRGGAAEATFANLRFRRTRDTDPMDGVARLKAIAREYGSVYPKVTQFVASEISLVRHLNAFGGDGALPVYKNAPNFDPSVEADVTMVKWLKSHGATVSINHPLHNITAAMFIDRVLRTNAFSGAHAIEIACHGRLSSHLYVLDVLARNAMLLTATGVTDDHSGMNWMSGTRWVTGVWAPSKSEHDLLVAIRNGRAWIFDPLYWNGELDLRVMGRARMGQAMFAARDRLFLQLRATQLPEGGSVHLVVGAADRPGLRSPRPAVSGGRTIRARDFIRGHWAGHLDIGKHGTYTRATIRNAQGRIVGLSNPLWIFPERYEGTIAIPAGRLAV
jgi:hypothetical protein